MSKKIRAATKKAKKTSPKLSSKELKKSAALKQKELKKLPRLTVKVYRTEDLDDGFVATISNKNNSTGSAIKPFTVHGKTYPELFAEIPKELKRICGDGDSDPLIPLK